MDMRFLQSVSRGVKYWKEKIINQATFFFLPCRFSIGRSVNVSVCVCVCRHAWSGTRVPTKQNNGFFFHQVLNLEFDKTY